MLLDLITRNRSYRRFDESKRISRSELVKLVNYARLAPSAANRQPLRYRLVFDPLECDKIFPRLRWAAYLKDWSGPEYPQRPAAYLIMLAPIKPNSSLFIDTGIAAQSILLAATEQGWGGCMIASADKESIHADLQLPPALEIVLVIALGVPAEKVVIDVLRDPDAVEYWRDEDDIHHVPKRSLEELILPEIQP